MYILVESKILKQSIVNYSLERMNKIYFFHINLEDIEKRKKAAVILNVSRLESALCPRSRYMFPTSYSYTWSFYFFVVFPPRKTPDPSLNYIPRNVHKY